MASKRTAVAGYKVERFTTWESFRKAIEGPDYRSWAFRGQGSSDWPLLSSLSRYLRDHRVHPRVWPAQEERVLRIFRRKAHLLLDHLPDEQDAFEWLALMQHHGAPTRLLDFSWSPYVAAFFALERATSDAAVWALFPPGVRPKREIRTALWVAGGYERYLLPNKHRAVVIGEPHRMNQRLIAQSGTFVVPEPSVLLGAFGLSRGGKVQCRGAQADVLSSALDRIEVLERWPQQAGMAEATRLVDTGSTIAVGATYSPAPESARKQEGRREEESLRRARAAGTGSHAESPPDRLANTK